MYAYTRHGYAFCMSWSISSHTSFARSIGCEKSAREELPVGLHQLLGWASLSRACSTVVAQFRHARSMRYLAG